MSKRRGGQGRGRKRDRRAVASGLDPVQTVTGAPFDLCLRASPRLTHVGETRGGVASPVGEYAGYLCEGSDGDFGLGDGAQRIFSGLADIEVGQAEDWLQEDALPASEDNDAWEMASHGSWMRGLSRPAPPVTPHSLRAMPGTSASMVEGMAMQQGGAGVQQGPTVSSLSLETLTPGAPRVVLGW